MTTFVSLGSFVPFLFNVQHGTFKSGSEKEPSPPADVYRIVCRRVLCRADGVDGHPGLLFSSRRAVGGSAGMT